MAAIGDSITASDYNSVRARINAVTAGYYLSNYPGLNTVSEGTLIDDAHFDTLEQAITYLYLHQNGTDPGITQNDAGDAILAGDGDGGSITSGIEDYIAVLDDVEAGTANHAANQFTQTGTAGKATSTTTWGGSTSWEGPETFTNNEGNISAGPDDLRVGLNENGRIEITWTINFGTTTKYNGFFELGGNLTFKARLGNSSGTVYTSEPSQAKRAWWYNHLNVANPINYVMDKAVLDAVTTSYVNVINKSDSDDATYNVNNTQLAIRKNSAGTSFDLRLRCNDWDVAEVYWPGTPVDENVNGSVITWVDMKRITASTNAYVNTDGFQPTITNAGYTVVDI